MRIRHLLAAALLALAASCGHKSETQTTTSTSATTTAPPAVVTPSSANSARGLTGTTTGGATATGAGQPAGFDTESAAQAHCASDQVVWLNTKTHVYHEKGMLYYGKTKAGAYVCRKEADAAGDHDTKNGK